jgi:chemotaxis protein methyltransferase CheR
MSASLTQTDAAFVRDLVYRRSAITLDESKHYLIEMRLSQLARDSGLSTIGELVNRAQQMPEMRTRIVEAMTTHETFFFRDLYPFEGLKRHVLPAIMASRGKACPLTIWSAACSTGQEPFSIAMLVLEHFPELARMPIRIVATDLSEQVLSRARTGRFRQMEVNRGLPASFLVKYFERVGAEWQIKRRVSDLVEFRQLNLLDPWQLTPVPDVVFMRNVLIYFDVPTRRSILSRVRERIPPDGALFLGSAETTLNIDDGWERTSLEGSTFYRGRP